eukprot:jgi/Botrbrau1/8229/Bobra.0392s0025.1
MVNVSAYDTYIVALHAFQGAGYMLQVLSLPDLGRLIWLVRWGHPLSSNEILPRTFNYTFLTFWPPAISLALWHKRRLMEAFIIMLRWPG